MSEFVRTDQCSLFIRIHNRIRVWVCKQGIGSSVFELWWLLKVDYSQEFVANNLIGHSIGLGGVT